MPERLSAEDRLDIMDLIARYAYTLDSGDLDGYVNNFAPEGVLFEQHKGREAIREYVGMLMRQGRAGPLPNGDVAYRHFVGSPVIDGGGDRAIVHSYLLWVNMGTEPPVSAAAEYTDECIKLDGRWYFLDRKLRRLAGRPPSSDPVIREQARA
jgi:SnoaL-like domain